MQVYEYSLKYVENCQIFMHDLIKTGCKWKTLQEQIKTLYEQIKKKEEEQRHVTRKMISKFIKTRAPFCESRESVTGIKIHCIQYGGPDVRFDENEVTRKLRVSTGEWYVNVLVLSLTTSGTSSPPPPLSWEVSRDIYET